MFTSRLNLAAIRKTLVSNLTISAIAQPGCQHYDRAYIWHLFKANESLAATLAAQHNIHYMNDLMKDIRQDIMGDKILNANTLCRIRVHL
jgi:tRNA-guanine family transglycosylase